MPTPRKPLDPEQFINDAAALLNARAAASPEEQKRLEGKLDEMFEPLRLAGKKYRAQGLSLQDVIAGKKPPKKKPKK